MSELNMDWVKTQLTENKTKKNVGNVVLDLLKTLTPVRPLLKADALDEVIDIFSKLSRGHALVVEDKSKMWAPVSAGNIKVTDVVRVKFNAFSDESGKNELNDRKGKVVAVRSGDIVIKTDDGRIPVLDGVHLKPEHLEKEI